MGKQYSKIEKRARRKRYNERLKDRVKQARKKPASKSVASKKK